jgi:cyanate permease
VGCAAAFVGSMALAPLVARSDPEAAATTAVVFAFGYLFAFAGPLLGGILIDGTHAVTTAFWPSIGAGVLMMVLRLLLPPLLMAHTIKAVP